MFRPACLGGWAGGGGRARGARGGAGSGRLGGGRGGGGGRQFAVCAAGGGVHDAAPLQPGGGASLRGGHDGGAQGAPRGPARPLPATHPPDRLGLCQLLTCQ
eukprot:1095376-Prorocentrum_minimum.AAC.1